MPDIKRVYLVLQISKDNYFDAKHIFAIKTLWFPYTRKNILFGFFIFKWLRIILALVSVGKYV